MVCAAKLSPRDQANLLAGHACAAAASYLEGRTDRAALATGASRLCSELMTLQVMAGDAALTDPTRLLVIVMMRAGASEGVREERWREIMRAFVRMVKAESAALYAEGASA